MSRKVHGQRERKLLKPLTRSECQLSIYGRCPHRQRPFRIATYQTSIMLETIAVLLIILWLLGLFTSYTLGGLIHVLLVIAVVAILFRLIRGRPI